ncbi:MAG: hypothetical protein QOH41_422 [Blastocatellia bacterium]|jgi:nucleotide-binding universal stress UspA family protein|nr:hypothetical protein [Blastocatellia bacterium]
MNRKVLAHVSGLVSIAGVVFSGFALFAILGKSLKLSEFSLSIITAVIAVVVGFFSKYLAGFAKRLQFAPRVFISYAHEDESIAHEVAEALRNHGARVWLDQERLKPGESINDAIEKGIADADSFVALVSGVPRPNLLLEIGMARARGLRVIPVLLADTSLPSDLQGLRYIDLRKEQSRGIEELVREAT